MAKIRIGIIGAGGIARRRTIPAMRHARNCKPVAVMDVANVDTIAQELGVPRSYTRAEDLVRSPDVDAVYIASPVQHHLSQIKLAASHKKPVLCEKPLTLSSAQAEEAVATCCEHGVVLQEGYMMKFHGAHALIRKMIESKELGRVVYMRAQLSCWYPPIEGAWRQAPETGGGGSLIDMATHLFDLLEFLANDRIKHVAALAGNLVHDYRSEDAATTLLEFAGGAHATVDTFFCIPDAASKTRLEIYGSQGSVLTEGTIGQGAGGTVQAILRLPEAGYDASRKKDPATTFAPLSFPPVNPYTAECEYFADCVAAGRQPAFNDGENAIHILRVAERAFESYKTKRILAV